MSGTTLESLVYLLTVQVVDFIEYSGGGGEDFAPVDGGYVQQSEAVPF